MEELFFRGWTFFSKTIGRSRKKKYNQGIIVPTGRYGRSQGENRNVDQFLMQQDNFTFHGRNEEGQLSNRAEHLSARVKRGKTAQRG